MPAIIDDIDEDVLDEPSDDPDLYNFSKFPTDLSNRSPQDLCDIVISNRYLGVFEGYATACMIELARRRQNGETFLFEEYIETELGELPKIEINPNSFASYIKK